MASNVREPRTKRQRVIHRDRLGLTYAVGAVSGLDDVFFQSPKHVPPQKFSEFSCFSQHGDVGRLNFEALGKFLFSSEQTKLDEIQNVAEIDQGVFH